MENHGEIWKTKMKEGIKKHGKFLLTNIDIIVDFSLLSFYFIQLVQRSKYNDFESLHLAMFFGFWLILFNIHMQRFKTMTGPDNPGFWKGKLEGYIEGSEPVMNAAQRAMASHITGKNQSANQGGISIG
jgi:hypothetical protein